MSMKDKNIEVMLKLFSAVERHDEQQQIALYQPNIEFHWPPSLYGGRRPGWDETWLPCNLPRLNEKWILNSSHGRIE